MLIWKLIHSNINWLNEVCSSHRLSSLMYSDLTFKKRLVILSVLLNILKGHSFRKVLITYPLAKKKQPPECPGAFKKCQIEHTNMEAPKNHSSLFKILASLFSSVKWFSMYSFTLKTDQTWKPKLHFQWCLALQDVEYI